MIKYKLSKLYIDENWEEVFNLIFEDWYVIIIEADHYKDKSEEYTKLMLDMIALVSYDIYRHKK